jgi:hypothetical protein
MKINSIVLTSLLLFNNFNFVYSAPQKKKANTSSFITQCKEMVIPFVVAVAFIIVGGFLDLLLEAQDRDYINKSIALREQYYENSIAILERYPMNSTQTASALRNIEFQLHMQDMHVQHHMNAVHTMRQQNLMSLLRSLSRRSF